MWTKSGIESEGQYAVTQELSHTLRLILETEETPESWRRIISLELKKQLLAIETISLQEIDTIFTIISGGDFLGLQAGSQALTKSNQLVTIVGFSSTWNDPSQLAAAENEVLQKLQLSMNIRDLDSQVVGLYFDPAAKERQELIKLGMNDVTPIIELDRERQSVISKLSLLNDPEILSHFMRILTSTEEIANQSTSSQLLLKQLTLHIMKSLSYMINIGGSEFLDHLKDQGLLETFVAHLYTRQASNSKAKNLIPVEWLEIKCTEIKKRAMENDLSLSISKDDMTANILNKKQIVVQSNDPESKEAIIQNAHLVSAINLHMVPADKHYKCFQTKDLIDFTAPPSKNGLLTKVHGMVFIEGQELIKLDNKAINILLQSEVVVTTADIKAQELYTKLIDISKKEDEKDEKERSMVGLLESVVLFLRKADFDRIQRPAQLKIKPIYRDAASPLEGIVQELSIWAGIDQDVLLYHLSDCKDEAFNAIAMKLMKVLKDIAGDKEKTKDKLKKLEVDKKLKELDAFKKKIAELEAKKSKDMEEKLAKLKESGFQLGGAITVKEGLVEKLVNLSVTTETEDKYSVEIPVIDLLNKDKKTNDALVKIIDTKVGEFREDVMDDGAKKKSEQAVQKEFYQKIFQFDDKSLSLEYDQSLSQLSQLYGRRTLVNILVHADQNSPLLASLLVDKQAQKTFACFLKSSFNEALVMKQSSGSKSQLKTIKKIIKNVFTYCVKYAKTNKQCDNFLRDFLHFDLLEQGIKTVQSMVEDSTKSVSDYFKSEEKVLTQLNPFLLTFILPLYLEQRPDILLNEKQAKLSNYLPNFFSISLYMILIFEEDLKSGIQARLFSLLVKILKFAESNLAQCTHNGAMQHLLNNELLKLMVVSVDYDSPENKYNNQMKMLLEIQMKLSDLHSDVQEIATIDTNLENSQGILEVRRGKNVLKEKQQFDYLKYLVHYDGLEDHHKEQMNQTIETNHYAYDAKILARFSTKQAQMLKVKFNEKIKIRDFTFLAVGSNPKIDKEMTVYSQEEFLTSELELFRGDFYLIYPVKKQLVVAFGEGQQDKLGVGSSSNTGPKACMSTKGLVSKKVFASYSHSVIWDKDDKLHRCGQIKRSANQNSEYEAIAGIEKVRLVALSKNTIVVVTEDNKIWRQGFSKDGHLGLNTDYSSMSKFEQIDEEDQITDKIIDISSGTHFTLFVTENGKLYGIGNRFLKEIGLDCDSKIIPIPLKEKVKVLRAYTSMGKQQPLSIIKILLESGEEQLWSAGRNEQGLLGQGPLIKTSKIFKPLKYDSQAVKFVDISIHSDHAMAITQNGEIYAWGSNLQKRSGFKEEIYDGIFEPRKLVFPEQENLRPLKVSCGFDHTLILFQDITFNIQKLYSVGANETNFHHLGISQVEAEETQFFYREISTFRGFNIVDFASGYRSSHVIIEGDKDIQSDIHEHKIQNNISKGVLHFYKDNNGVMKYVTAEDYEKFKDNLPDLSLAIKCPIEKIEENHHFPDLVKLAQELLDYDSLETVSHSQVQCDATEKPIEGSVRYFSYSRINGDELKVNLSEKTFLQPNVFDLNPLIYYRLRRPIKKGQRLPIIDLKNFYKETAEYGLDIQVEPQLQFERNDKLIELTKTIYDDVLETISKFLPELDAELLKEVDRYVKANLSDKSITDIKAKDDFKIADMVFKNPKLKKLSENVKRKRIELYLHFNKIFINLMPYISLDEKASGGDMTKQFQEVKNMILFSMKNKFIQNSINSLPSGNEQNVEIRRRKAQRFCETGAVDHKGEYTIFGQIFQQIKQNNAFDCFRMNTTDQKTWRTKFHGEGSIDAGGPYREALTNMCTEMESENLPLLIKTANNRNNHGENRDCFIPNHHSNNPTHFELFRFLGHFLGYGIRTLCPIPLHFPPVFWKQILGESLELKDFKGFDTYSWQIIEDLKKQAEKLTSEEFEIQIQEKFITRLSDGTEVELKKGGKMIDLTKANLEEYISLILETRFNEYQNQLKAIKEGINFVIPIDMLKLFTWEEVESRACGDKVVDIDKFKKMTNYSCCDENHEQIKQFWKVIESFNDEERQLYLKFVWGRSRLPYDIENIRDRHEIYYEDDKSDKDFPVAHTCFFQLDLPKYSTEEICRQRIYTAITMCGEIDADNNAEYIDDDDDVE